MTEYYNITILSMLLKLSKFSSSTRIRWLPTFGSLYHLLSHPSSHSWWTSLTKTGLWMIFGGSCTLMISWCTTGFGWCLIIGRGNTTGITGFFSSFLTAFFTTNLAILWWSADELCMKHKITPTTNRTALKIRMTSAVCAIGITRTLRTPRQPQKQINTTSWTPKDEHTTYCCRCLIALFDAQISVRQALISIQLRTGV